jgi:large subunit ribosomal protein L25
MEPLTLTAELRAETGKGPARRLRARDLIPGVFYGQKAEAVGVAVAPKPLTHALASPQRRNVLLKLEVSGKEHLCMIKELQVHPVTRKVLHIDLYKVSLEQPVEVRVPFLTEGRAKGVVAGGEINVIYRELPVRTTPDKIPPVILVDVTNMALGDFIRTKDLQLPPGVEVTFDPERSLVSCAEPRKRPLDEDEIAAAAAQPAADAAAATPPAAT